MMNVLVVLGHPNRGSFNHAIADTVCDALQANGHQVIFHDLCAEQFDPVMQAGELPQDARVPEPVRRYCDELQRAGGLVVIHPNWWGQPPAILKGWIDRVFRPGIAYRFDEDDSGEGVPVGLLNLKAALILNTSNTADDREQAMFGDPLEGLWKRCILDLCGVREVHRRTFSVVVASTLEERKRWLAEAAALTTDLFPKETSSPKQ